MTCNKLLNDMKNLFRGKITTEERNELTEMVDSASFNTMMRDAWDASPNQTDEKLSSEIWGNIITEIQTKDDKTNFASQIRPNKNRFNRYLKIAAMVAVIFALGSTGYFITPKFLNGNNGNQENFMVKVERGQKAQMRLPDGTEVWLNSDSRITYNSNYNKKDRVINLEGEAYFDVAKNPSKRFVVKCNGVDLGGRRTSKKVKSYSNEGTITTTLAQGKVKVSSANESMTLLPQDVARYNIKNKSLERDYVEDLKLADYWRTDQMVFDEESLASICKTLERMYGVNIIIRDTKIKDIHFSGTLCNNSLNNVFHMISLTYPIKYTINDSTIWIDSDI